MCCRSEHAHPIFYVVKKSLGSPPTIPMRSLHEICLATTYSSNIVAVSCLMLCVSLHWAFAFCCLSVISLFYWSFSSGSQGRSKRSHSMILTWGTYLLCVDPHLWAHIYLLRQINPPVFCGFFFSGIFLPCSLLVWVAGPFNDHRKGIVLQMTERKNFPCSAFWKPETLEEADILRTEIRSLRRNIPRANISIW